MSESLLMKGNEALAEAAIRAGCRFYFGYPITPQNGSPSIWRDGWVSTAVSLYWPRAVSSINMVYGAAGASGRVLISSSSPGISLCRRPFPTSRERNFLAS